MMPAPCVSPRGRPAGRFAAAVLLLVALALASGCATRKGGDPRDPFEPFNRDVTKFNDAADRIVLKPVATGYTQLVPPLVRTGVSNFFSNVTDVWTFINSTLQLKVQSAGETLIRLSVNTTLGLGGIIDVASELGIDKYNEDFGLTLGRYGVPAGPYVVLPLLGPSTVRDTLAFGVESSGNPLRGIDNDATRSAVYVLNAVDKRAAFLEAGDLLEEAALDKYTFSRDAYLQRRGNLIARNKADEDYSASPAAAPAAPASAPASAASAPKAPASAPAKK
ncbi:MAG: VacJ family lipoprotein [Pseudomonadota bacterium]